MEFFSMTTGQRCVKCVNLTIVNLVRLASEEFAQPDAVPKYGHFKHHKSVQGLEDSAVKRCDFCSLVIDCLKRYSEGSVNRLTLAREWRDDQCVYEDSLYAAAKNLPMSDVKISIACQGRSRTH